MSNTKTPAALPATDDIAALAEMHSELTVERRGDPWRATAVAEGGGRRLDVYWRPACDEDDEDGWAYETGEEDVDNRGYGGGGALGSARELAGLVEWVAAA